jgi:signal transduction histidine kinase
MWHNVVMPLKFLKVFNHPNEQIEHESLSSLINSMADAVIALDQDYRIIIYNGAALNILDINNISLNSPLNGIFKPIDKDNQPVNINDLIKSADQPITDRNLRLKYSDSSIINLYISIAPVRLGYREHGQYGFVLMLRDISREKSLEEERDEFISIVSHELRTPVTIAEGNISNAIFITDSQDTDESIKQALNVAHAQVIFLADMINDLSTLSRAEQGSLSLEIEKVDIGALIKQICASYQDEAGHKGIEIKSELPARPLELSTSQLYLKEILQNFVTNAIKYTHEGEIVIEAVPVDKGIKFTVSDTGIGISKPDQEKVFDKFFRSEDYRTREAKGTGLGLYVTLKLARLIHAQLSLSSELNKGSSFSIFIPDLD